MLTSMDSISMIVSIVHFFQLAGMKQSQYARSGLRYCDSATHQPFACARDQVLAESRSAV